MQMYHSVLDKSVLDKGPRLDLGIARLCAHFSSVCNFGTYMFAVVINRVRSNNADPMTKLPVDHLLNLKELTTKISQTYLHVPRSYDFRINKKIVDFKYWQRRRVEFSRFDDVKINSSVPILENQKDSDTRSRRIYAGFDVQTMLEKRPYQ